MCPGELAVAPREAGPSVAYYSALSSVRLGLSRTLQLPQACNVCLCKPAGQEAVASLLPDAPKLHPQPQARALAHVSLLL